MSVENIRTEAAVNVAVTTATVTGKALLDAVNWLTPIASKPSVPVLATVRFDVVAGELTASAYNWEDRLVIALGPVDGPDVSVIAPHGSLLSVVKALAGKGVAQQRQPLDLVLSAGHVAIGQSGNLAWTDKDLADYPDVSNLDDGRAFRHVVTADAKTFITEFDRLALSASKDNTLPILTAARIEAQDGYVVGMSTDRYRLTRTAIDGVATSEDVAFLVPMLKWAKWKRALKGADQVSLYYAKGKEGAYDGGTVRIAAPGVELTLTGGPGEYPRIRSLFPDRAENRVTMNRAALLTAATAAGEVAARNTPIKMEFDGTHVTLLTIGEAGVMVCGKVAYEGSTEVTVQAFNPGYLLDMLKGVTGDTVSLAQTTAPKPAVWAGSEDELMTDLAYNYLLMPVRLPSN